MRHTETVRLSGKAVTAAVAAALLAMASAANSAPLTPPRISSTLDNSAADVTVTYTDNTANTDIIYAPVEPGSADALTVNVNSLTVVNLTTAGTVQIQTGTKDVTGSDGTVTQEPVYTTYDKNGGGIATNPAFPGTSITLPTAKALSVTARTAAISAGNRSGITGSIGGDLILKSTGGEAISVTEATAGENTAQTVNLALNGGKATIKAEGAGDAVYASGMNSSVSLSGASDYVITSETGSALRSVNGATDLGPGTERER